MSNYGALTTDGQEVNIPDEVFENQKAWDGKTFTATMLDGSPVTARLRGDLYGLHTAGTGDAVVEVFNHSFEKFFEGTPELTAWVEFQAQENGLAFHWDKVQLRAWADNLSEQQAHDLMQEELCS